MFSQRERPDTLRVARASVDSVGIPVYTHVFMYSGIYVYDSFYVSVDAHIWPVHKLVGTPTWHNHQSA